MNIVGALPRSNGGLAGKGLITPAYQTKSPAVFLLAGLNHSCLIADAIHDPPLGSRLGTRIARNPISRF
jgi:hypothetical protein